MFHSRINQVVGFYQQNVWKSPVEDGLFLQKLKTGNLEKLETWNIKESKLKVVSGT